MEFWIAVVALVLATWCLLTKYKFGPMTAEEYEKIHRRISALEALCGNPAGDGRRASLDMVQRMDDRLRNMEVRLDAWSLELEQYGEKLCRDAMPRLLRTPRGDGLEIRNVDGED